MSAMVPVLLDTDIGTDIDDALCLAYLLAQPRCELVGITTVSGQAQARAALADALCRAQGRPDVPIFAGADQPLLGPSRQPEAQQAEVLPNWPHRADFAAEAAVDFMRETIRRRPGEIVLLTIGPLTNAALLFKLDPEIPKLLRGFVMMGGTFGRALADPGPVAEWNIWQDPVAAAIVFAAGGPPPLCVGLDVTRRCRLSAQECRRRLPTSGALAVVRDAAEIWFRRASEITFHDPLAAVALFEPGVITEAAGRIDVELRSEKLYGATLWEPGAQERPHRIAAGVDVERFFAHYFEIVE
ncbi:MAG TPA: nucleoside hydrolase [Limnochordia bacterium]|nr:nucleoside hydrolase [Limnochordia bacterium]